MTTEAQEPFSLVKEGMHIEVKKRTEKNGDEDVTAYDVYLKGDFANAVLLKLDPALRESFYKPAKQQDIEQDFYPDLKFPLLGATVDYGLEKSRMTLQIHDCDSPVNDLVLKGLDIDKMKLTMKQGGTVQVAFRAIVGRVTDEDVLLKLLRIDHQKAPVSLEQAPVEEVPDNFEKVDLLSSQNMSPERAEAEKAFAALAQEEAPPSDPDAFQPPPEIAPPAGQEPAAQAPAKRKPRGSAKGAAAIE